MEERTLCWFCKKTTADCNKMCQWMHQNKPMKNWIAEKGDVVRYRDMPGDLHRGHGYTVLECPYFERDTEWLDYADVAKDVSNTLGFKNYSQFYVNPLKNLKQYHEITGKNIPEWVFEEIEYLTARKKDSATNADNTQEEGAAKPKKKKRKTYQLTDEDYQELIAGGFDTRWI